MSGNPVTDFLRSQEDRNRLLKIEQLRRQGEVFIKVKYTGRIIPQVDSDGVCYNIRLHGLKDMEAYEQTDINTGRTEWRGRQGAKMLSFSQSISGDIEADIWDDPDHWNRRFIATHPEELFVVDAELRKQIEKELDKPFKAELTRKEELERTIAENVKELEKLTDEEKVVRKYERKKKNGVDKSASDVDSSGMSRVAAGRVGKGDTAAI